MLKNQSKDFRNLKGKLVDCVRPLFLSGAGKPNTVMAQTLKSNLFLNNAQKKPSH